jgi:hypothetical protein
VRYRQATQAEILPYARLAFRARISIGRACPVPAPLDVVSPDFDGSPSLFSAEYRDPPREQSLKR